MQLLKFVDFVGEYHLDLIVKYGGCPIIVPRVEYISEILDAFEPIHGVLLAEGEDIGEKHRPADDFQLDRAQLSAILDAHPSDAAPDLEKDSIEFLLVEKCVKQHIPLLGICRGSQVVNAVSGGSLYLDIEAMTQSNVKHIDYSNYDDHRHPISIVPETPLANWFGHQSEINVNSYHHQGVKRLGSNLVPMAHAPDGLVEAFYDPDNYDPPNGRFLIGLQFHPERMQNTALALEGNKNTYDYVGCPTVYEKFVLAARAYRAKLSSNQSPIDIAHDHEEAVQSESIDPATSDVPANLESPIPDELKHEHNGLVKAFDLASKVYNSKIQAHEVKLHSEKVLLSKGGAFLEAVAPLSKYSRKDLDRIIRSGATVHGSTLMRRMLEDNELELNELAEEKQEDAWARFTKAISAVEDAMGALQGTDREIDALRYIRRLSNSVMNRENTCEEELEY